jgi:hypothetical protein
MRAVGVVLALIGGFGIGGIGLLALAGAWLYSTAFAAGPAASSE